MKNRFIVSALVTVVASIPVIAEESMSEVVVTATRTPQPITETLSSVTLITAADIERLQPVDLIDLFNHVPGIDISRSGGDGSTPGLYMRGTNTSHTLFLIDGQRINSASLGDTSFQFLDPNQIERIEVVRGAKSSIYGSDAIGGVIQIFTKKGRGAPQTTVSTEVGSNALNRTAVSTNGSQHNFRYALNLSYLDTDSIDSKVDDTGTNRDRDGYRNRSVNASLGYEFSSGIDVGLNFLQTNTRNYYDDSSTEDPFSDGSIQNIVLNIDVPVTDWWQSKVSVGHSTDDKDSTDGITGTHKSDFRTKRENIFWQNDFSIAENHLLTVGYDFYDDELTSSQGHVYSDGSPVSDRDNNALFAQYQGQLSIFDVIVGFREDDNEAFGTHTTGNVALGVQVGEDHRVVLSWAEGFKAPTFNDLYWPIGTYGIGNPGLEPEESENYELGFFGNYDAWRWELSVYQNSIDNLIQWAPANNPAHPLAWTPTNVSTAKIKGGELVVSGQLAGWNISSAYGYTNPQNEETDKVLLKRSKKSFLLGIDRRFSRWDFGADMKANGKRYTNEANTSSLGGYTLFDVRVGYHVTDKLKAQLKVENIFDKHYRTNESSFSSFNEDGTSWVFKLSYSI